MTKKDLVNSVCCANPSIPAAVVERAVTLVFETMASYLMRHQRIEIRGLGVFTVRKRAAHKAHNPQTGKPLIVPDKYVPFFKASQSLKTMLKDPVKRPEATNFFTAIYRDLTGKASSKSK